MSVKLKKIKILQKEYKLHGKYSINTILRQHGKWSTILKKAGLEKPPEKSKEQLIIEDIRLIASNRLPYFIELGPYSFEEYLRLGKYKYETVLKYFLNWRQVLRKAGLLETKNEKE